MALHLVVGAGPIGRSVAEQLVDRGNEVRLVSRSASGEPVATVTRVAADAADADRLTALADGRC